MLIILEGPDGGGKSTLAERFRKARDGSLDKAKPPAFREYRSQLGGRTMPHDEMRANTYGVMNQLRNGKLENGVLLLERMHAISDDVYRTLFGGPRFLSAAETEAIMSDLGKANALVVYCRPPVQAVIDAGLQKAGDDTEEWLGRVGRGIRTLYSHYDQTMNRLAWFHRVPILRYDFTDEAAASAVERLVCAG